MYPLNPNTLADISMLNNDVYCLQENINYAICTILIISITITIIFGIYISHISHAASQTLKALLEQHPVYKDDKDQTRKKLHYRVYPPCAETRYQAIVAVKDLRTNTNVSAFRMDTLGNYGYVWFRFGHTWTFKQGFSTSIITNYDNNDYMVVPSIHPRNREGVYYYTGMQSNPEPLLFGRIYGKEYMIIKKDRNAIHI